MLLSPVPPPLHSVQFFASSVGHGRSEGIRIDIDSFDSYVQDIVSYMSDMKHWCLVLAWKDVPSAPRLCPLLTSVVAAIESWSYLCAL